MEKEEAAEDLPHVSTFHLALADSATYYRWRYVGVEQQFDTDEDIACFLLECYEKEKREKQSDRGVCLTCQSPLQLLCVHCHVSVEDTVTAVTGGRGRGKVSKKSVRAAVTKADRRRGAAQDSRKTGPTPSTRRGRGNNSTPDNKGDNSQPANKVDNSQPDSSSPVTGARRGRKRKSSEVKKTLRHKSELPLPPLEVEVKEEEEYEEGGGGRLEMVVMDTKPVHDSLPSLPPQPESDAGSVERGAQDSQRGLKHEMSDGGMDIETHEDHKPGKGSEIHDGGIGIETHGGPKPGKRRKIDDECKPKRKAKPGKKRGTKEGRFGTGTRDVDAKPGSKKRGRPRIRRAVCEECGTTLTSDLTLLHHMQAQHPLAPLPPPLSLLAAKEMADDEKVKARLKRKAELASLTCATCHVTFDSKTKMSQHWKRQCQWKVCDLCGKSVKALDMHMKRHLHPKRFACPHCPKTYLFKTYLETHLLYHNREKPFCCEICGMRYYEKFRLNAHIRTHTGDKPFKCTQCDAAFTRSRGLSDHLRVHTGEKPYACQVCARQFASTGNLAAHRRKVHKLEPQIASPSKQRLLPVAGAPPPLPPPPCLIQGGAGVGTGEQEVKQDHAQTEDGQPLTSLQPVESGQRGMEPSRFSEDITQPHLSQDVAQTVQTHELTQMAQRQDLSEAAQRHDMTQMAQRQEMTQTEQRNDVTQAAQRLDLTQIAQSHDLTQTAHIHRQEMTQTAHTQDLNQTQEMIAPRHDAMQPHLYQDITQTKQRQDNRQTSQRQDAMQPHLYQDITQTKQRQDNRQTSQRQDLTQTAHSVSAVPTDTADSGALSVRLLTPGTHSAGDQNLTAHILDSHSRLSAVSKADYSLLPDRQEPTLTNSSVKGHDSLSVAHTADRRGFSNVSLEGRDFSLPRTDRQDSNATNSSAKGQDLLSVSHTADRRGFSNVSLEGHDFSLSRTDRQDFNATNSSAKGQDLLSVPHTADRQGFSNVSLEGHDFSLPRTDRQDFNATNSSAKGQDLLSVSHTADRRGFSSVSLEGRDFSLPRTNQQDFNATNSSAKGQDLLSVSHTPDRRGFSNVSLEGHDFSLPRTNQQDFTATNVLLESRDFPGRGGERPLVAVSDVKPVLNPVTFEARPGLDGSSGGHTGGTASGHNDLLWYNTQ